MTNSTTYYAYLIAPMDEPGTQTRENFNSLKDFIRDTLGDGCEIKGGDDVLEGGQVYEQVIKEIRKADFCIADISEQNVNVYYEIGFCKAIEKPMIFLKRLNSEEVPVDIGLPKWVDYDLDRGYQVIRRTKVELLGHYISIIDGLKNKPSSDAGNGRSIFITNEQLYAIGIVTQLHKQIEKNTLPTDQYIDELSAK